MSNLLPVARFPPKIFSELEMNELRRDEAWLSFYIFLAERKGIIDPVLLEYHIDLMVEIMLRERDEEMK